jgi:TRAP-type C4-dicarboxylate transport system permease small subunit
LAQVYGKAGELMVASPPVKWTATANRLLDGIAWLCMLVAGIAVVVMIAIFGWLVYGRYILNDTPTWVEQLSLLLINYITFLGAAVGVRRHTHLSIDFIREGFPRVLRAIMRCLSDLTIIVFGAFMAWQGWILVSTNLDREIPMIGLSESWRAAPLLISGVLIMLFASVDLVGRLSSQPNAPAATKPQS